jgi:hypothetical protein
MGPQNLRQTGRWTDGLIFVAQNPFFVNKKSQFVQNFKKKIRFSFITK